MSDRELGPEMTAEQWFVATGDWIFWIHPPSNQSVSVDGPIKWENCSGIPALRGDPIDRRTEGYVVSCRRHDDQGNPYEGECFWIESYGEAVKHARAWRLKVLGTPPDASAEQLTLDDVIARKASA